MAKKIFIRVYFIRACDVRLPLKILCLLSGVPALLHAYHLSEATWELTACSYWWRMFASLPACHVANGNRQCNGYPVPMTDRSTTSSTFSDQRHPCSLVSKVGCLLSFQRDEEKWAKCFFISVERCSNPTPAPTFFFLLPLRWSICQILETWVLVFNKQVIAWLGCASHSVALAIGLLAWKNCILSQSEAGSVCVAVYWGRTEVVFLSKYQT